MSICPFVCLSLTWSLALKSQANCAPRFLGPRAVAVKMAHNDSITRIGVKRGNGMTFSMAVARWMCNVAQLYKAH